MIGLGLIGLGHWGPNLAKCVVNSKKGKLKWMCDINQARLEQMASRYPDSQLTTECEDLLTDKSVEAVIIATPVATHFSLAKRAIELKKHLLVEKPLCMASSEVYELNNLAQAKNTTLMVGHVFEYNPTILALKKMIEDEQLGDIQYLNFTRTNLGPIRTDVDAMWDLATHDISILNLIMPSPVIKVSAKAGSFINAGINDVVFATYTFETGALAHIHCSWLHPQKVRQITVVGSKKMAVLDDLNLKNPLTIFDKKISSHPLTDDFLGFKTLPVDGGQYTPKVPLYSPLQAQCDHFIDCIQNSLIPKTDAMNAYRVLKILEVSKASVDENGADINISIPS